MCVVAKFGAAGGLGSLYTVVSINLSVGSLGVTAVEVEVVADVVITVKTCNDASICIEVEGICCSCSCACFPLNYLSRGIVGNDHTGLEAGDITVFVNNDGRLGRITVACIPNLNTVVCAVVSRKVFPLCNNRCTGIICGNGGLKLECDILIVKLAVCIHVYVPSDKLLVVIKVETVGGKEVADNVALAEVESVNIVTNSTNERNNYLFLPLCVKSYVSGGNEGILNRLSALSIIEPALEGHGRMRVGRKRNGNKFVVIDRLLLCVIACLKVYVNLGHTECVCTLSKCYKVVVCNVAVSILEIYSKGVGIVCQGICAVNAIQSECAESGDHKIAVIGIAICAFIAIKLILLFSIVSEGSNNIAVSILNIYVGCIEASVGANCFACHIGEANSNICLLCRAEYVICNVVYSVCNSHCVSVPRGSCSCLVGGIGLKGSIKHYIIKSRVSCTDDNARSKINVCRICDIAIIVGNGSIKSVAVLICGDDIVDGNINSARLSIYHSDLGKATVRIGCAESEAVSIKSQGSIAPGILSSNNLIAIIKLTVKDEVGIGLSVIGSNQFSNNFFYCAVFRCVVHQACCVIGCSDGFCTGPYGCIGKHGYFDCFDVGALTLADSFAYLCLGGSYCHSPCTVGVVGSLSNGYGYRTEILRGVNLLTLCKMGRSSRDLRGPNGNVGKYGDCAVFLITARTLADSCACLCLGGSYGNYPCAVTVIVIGRKNYLYSAVSLGGINLFTLGKM